MSDEISSCVLLAALLSVLNDALESDEVKHLVNERFKADVRGLQARVEAELDAHSTRRPLHLAEDADDSVADD